MANYHFRNISSSDSDDDSESPEIAPPLQSRRRSVARFSPVSEDSGSPEEFLTQFQPESPRSQPSSSMMSLIQKLANKCNVQQLKRILGDFQVLGVSKARKNDLIKKATECYSRLDESRRRKLQERLQDPSGKERAVSSTSTSYGSTNGSSSRSRAHKPQVKRLSARVNRTRRRFPDEDEEGNDDDGEEAEDSDQDSNQHQSTEDDRSFAPSEDRESVSETSTSSAESVQIPICPPIVHPSKNAAVHREKSQAAPIPDPVNRRLTLTIPKYKPSGTLQQPPGTGTSPSSSVSSRIVNVTVTNAGRIATSVPSSVIRPYVPRTHSNVPLPPPLGVLTDVRKRPTDTPSDPSKRQSFFLPPPSAVPLQDPYASNLTASSGYDTGTNDPDNILHQFLRNTPLVPVGGNTGPSTSGQGVNPIRRAPPQFAQPAQYQPPSSSYSAPPSSNFRGLREYSSPSGGSNSGNGGFGDPNGGFFEMSEAELRRLGHLVRNYSNDSGFMGQQMQQTVQTTREESRFPPAVPSQQQSSSQQQQRHLVQLAGGVTNPYSLMSRGVHGGGAAINPYRPQPAMPNSGSVLRGHAPMNSSMARQMAPGAVNGGNTSIMANNPFAAAFTSISSTSNGFIGGPERTDTDDLMDMFNSPKTTPFSEPSTAGTPTPGPKQLKFPVVCPNRPTTNNGYGQAQEYGAGRAIKPPVFHHTLFDVSGPLSIRRDATLTTRGVYREIITTFFFNQAVTNPNDHNNMVLIRFCQETLTKPSYEMHPDNLKLMLNGKTLVEPAVVDFSNRMKKKKNAVYNQPIEVPVALLAAQNVVLIRWTEDTSPISGALNTGAADEPPKDFCFIIEYARRKTMEEILEAVAANRVYVSTTVYKLYQSLSGAGGDDDIVTDSQKISLLCPASRLRISLPVRGQNCDHVECFDASSFLFMNKAQKARWTCPKCNKPVQFDELVVDDFIQRLLEAFPVAIESIEATFENGEIVVRESRKAEKKVDKGSSSISDLQRSSSNSSVSQPSGSGFASSSSLSAKPTSSSKPAPDIITLD